MYNSKGSARGEKQGAYSKIFAVVRKYREDQSVFSRSNRVDVYLTDADNVYTACSDSPSGVYQKMAGGNLSNIFMPFETRVNASGGFPGFASGLNTTTWLNEQPSGQAPKFHMLLPFEWRPTDTSNIYDRYVKPSGDSLGGMISSDRFYADVDQYRDLSNIRGVALRGPLLLTGWGYTLNENHPWPSGGRPANAPSGATYFKGPGNQPTTKGWEVDPSDYVTAPVDLRYDQTRHVWTCGAGVPGGQGIYSVLMRLDDITDGTVGWEYPRFHS